MLKRKIKYIDFNDEEQEDIYYFNLTKTEILELEAGEEGVSFSARMTRIVEAKDIAIIIDEIKKLILLAYGEKSMDGKQFIKSDELRDAFAQTAAFDALFIELSQDAEETIKFLKGALPKDMGSEFDKAIASGDIPGVPAGRTPGLPTQEEFNRSREAGTE